jgi:urea transport system ATP-binding protein
MVAMLRFENVTSGYDGIPINRNISLEVAEGQVVAIVGRNGVGKSTLARTIVGLLRPSNGRIFFDGEDVTLADARRRALTGMGYVPQGREIFGRLTVEENLSLSGRRSGHGLGRFGICRMYTSCFRSCESGAGKKVGH